MPTHGYGVRGVLLSLAVLLAGGCATPAALKKQLPQQGDVISGVLPLPHVDVPLPEGPWTVVGRFTYYNNLKRVNADILLIQVERDELGKNEINAMLSISTNLETGYRGFENICTPQALQRALYAKVTAARDWRQDCWSIDYQEMSFSQAFVTKNRDVAEARKYVRQHGILVPIDMVYVKHRLSNVYNYLTIWRYFNPDLAGVPQTRFGGYEKSDWNKNNIGHFPRKQAYIEQLKGIATAWQARLRAAFF